jgi:H+/Cl- antiporter ClcA
MKCFLNFILKQSFLFFNGSKQLVLYPQLLIVGCSIGVGVGLGTPIGGVLFSVEATSTFYLTRNYWWAIFAAPLGALFYLIMSNSYYDQRMLFGFFSN